MNFSDAILCLNSRGAVTRAKWLKQENKISYLRILPPSEENTAINPTITRCFKYKVPVYCNSIFELKQEDILAEDWQEYIH